MTEKEIYKNGVALLEEWEDVNYCEHAFKFKDEWLTDKEVVDLLNQLNDENEELKQFKEKAFDIINKTIEREIIIAENIEKTTHSPPGSAINRGTISTLENLKMELEE